MTMQERGLDPIDTTALVGLDQGQGSLKVALTLVNNNEEEKENQRSKYSQVFLLCWKGFGWSHGIEWEW